MGYYTKRGTSMYDRIFLRVTKTDTCWLWTGATEKAGYGRIGKHPTYSVHRLAYEFAYGPIPVGMCVCHHCDTPACVRSDHLFLGTHGDNARDREDKGRGYVPTWHGMECHAAKLTDDIVREIRRVHVPYSRTVGRYALARKYSVTRSAIDRIINNVSWCHIL